MITIMYTEYEAATSALWKTQLRRHSGGVVCTRILRDRQFLKGIRDNSKYLILHAIFSGFEGSVYEPMVPDINKKMEALNRITARVMKPEQVVLRINPVVPTEDGMKAFAWIMDTAPKGIRIKLDFLRMTKGVEMSLEKLRSAGHKVIEPSWDGVDMPTDLKLEVIRYAGNWKDKFQSINTCCNDDYKIPIKFKAGCVCRADHKALRLSEWFYGDYKPTNENCTCSKTKRSVYDPESVAVKCAWNGNL